MFERKSAGVLVCSLALALPAAGCRKDAAPPAGEAAPSATAEAKAAPGSSEMTPESTIVEESDQGTITWSVTPEGHVEAVVKGTDGNPVTRDVTGLVTWPGDAGDDIEHLTVNADGHLVAQGPALEADLTEIDYDLVVSGKPWSGTLHVPRGGTRAIEADAQAGAAVEVPAGKKGPNGGTIQIIGARPVELVADKVTGEVRVYFLGPNFEVIDPPEPPRVRLGYVADEVETIELVREPGQLYWVGGVRSRIDPVRVTLAVGFGADVHVGIVGWSFGMSLGVGVRAPVIPLWVERGWAPSVAVRVGVDVRVRERIDVRTGGRVDVRDRVDVRGRDRVDVRGREHVEVREHGGREHGHHDNGVRDHGAGQGRHGADHGGGHAAPSHGGSRGGHGGKKH